MSGDVKCWVYWIRGPEMTDIFTEGYVGITTNPHVRIQQHIANARTNTHHKYPEEFRQCLLTSYVFDLILIGSVEYCMDIEYKLRPELYIGWNRAEGANGAFLYKHGLTGSRVAKTYYNMLTRAKETGEAVCDEWLGEQGLVNFAEFYQNTTDDTGQYSLVEIGQGYTPQNFKKMSRSDFIRRAYRRHDIGGDRLYSVAELGEKFGIKSNTISSRIRDGWTPREAVGLDIKTSKSRKHPK